MWSERRAEAVRRELVSLGTAGLEVDDLQSRAAESVHRVVPYDATCWGTVDPVSNMITGSLTIHFDPAPQLAHRFAEIEASGDDVNSFGFITASGRAVARLSDTDAASLDASPRLADIYRPLGFGHELRAAFSVDGTCWGVAGLLRGDRATDFTDQEVEFLASVSLIVARALRAAVLTRQAAEGVELASAVLIVGEDGAVVAATPQAEARLAALGTADGTGLAPAMLSVVAAIRTRRVAHAQARLRDAHGSWVTIAASPLTTAQGESQVAVMIEPTVRADLTDLVLAAHGLSMREQDVCRQVLAGKSTNDIAAALYISANTVQDHLKSVFAKTGFRSRRDLVAALSTQRSGADGHRR